MNVDKAKKRIAKQVKKGFKGYPQLIVSYFGETNEKATGVNVTLILEEGAAPQEERFMSDMDAREDEVIQTVLVKIMERVQANTVTEVDGISIL